jgi:hypothetical protein
MIFQQKDLNDLKNAKTLLENPGLAAKITNLLGNQLKKGLHYCPKIGECKSVN